MTRRTLFTLLSSLPLASFADPELDLDESVAPPDLISVRIEGIADLLINTVTGGSWLIFYGSRYNRVVPLKYGPDESGNIAWSTRGEEFTAPVSDASECERLASELAYAVTPIGEPVYLGGPRDFTLSLIDKMQKERK